MLLPKGAAVRIYSRCLIAAAKELELSTSQEGGEFSELQRLWFVAEFNGREGGDCWSEQGCCISFEQVSTAEQPETKQLSAPHHFQIKEYTERAP